jgi:hypothetical protein
MRKFFKKIWNAWKEVQEDRAKFYAKHGDCWE